MKWEIDERLPIHKQLVDEIIKRVVNKYYAAGERIPPVRELSVEAKVNPNTMQKALQELEEKKIIYTQRTTGKFITNDVKIITNLKNDISNKVIINFLKDMKNLGFDKNQALEMLNEIESFAEKNKEEQDD